jgi:hypothetical protein
VHGLSEVPGWDHEQERAGNWPAWCKNQDFRTPREVSLSQ